jgi:hypothetical protein
VGVEAWWRMPSSLLTRKKGGKTVTGNTSYEAMAA